MEKSETLSGAPARTPVVHCYDTQAHRIVCGAPGQIGSTKHARDVTCEDCLERLGMPSRSTLHFAGEGDAAAAH